MTDDPKNKFVDDVCHCIECVRTTDPNTDAPPYLYRPDEQEKMEILRNEKEYGLIGE